MQESNSLRFADRYFGQLICAGIDLLRFHPKQKSRDPEKILLIELFEMGAAIMLAPSIQHIKSKYPKAEIHCLTTATCLPIWEALNLIDSDKIHLIKSKSALSFAIASAQMILSLRKIKFDLIIDFELFFRVSAILSGLLRATNRAGFFKYDFEGLWRGRFYNRVSAYNQNTHISKNYLALTKASLMDSDDIPAYKGSITKDEIHFSPKPIYKNLAYLQNTLGPSANGEIPPYIIVCADVGKTLPMRNYPPAYFTKLLKILSERYKSHAFVFIGTESEDSITKQIIRDAGSGIRAINLCGKTRFSELLSIIASAELVITNDNGPGHFATLTGTKVLALFSTDSPFVYGPLGKAVIAYSYFHCSPCISAYNHKTSRCNNNKCLQALSPEFVADLAQTILDGTARFGTVNNEMPYIF